MTNVLLIGLGGMGRVHYINASFLENVCFVASVGNSESDKNTAISFSLPYYESIEDALYHHPEITVADITTPSFLHKEHALKALSYGLDIIIEKPLALKKSDAEEIYKKGEEKGRKIYPAHVLRYTKEYGPLKEIVESKRYGDVIYATFSRLSSWPSWSPSSWFFDKNKSGLVPFDLHIHDLDIIINTFGFPKSYEAMKDERAGLYYRFRYNYEGAKVDAEAAWLKAPIPFMATYRVIFERAVLILDGTSLILYEDGKGSTELDISYDKVVETGINVPPTGWYYEELKAIFALIKENKESSVEKDEVLKELEILENM